MQTQSDNNKGHDQLIKQLQVPALWDFEQDILPWLEFTPPDISIKMNDWEFTTSQTNDIQTNFVSRRWDICLPDHQVCITEENGYYIFENWARKSSHQLAITENELSRRSKLILVNNQKNTFNGVCFLMCPLTGKPIINIILGLYDARIIPIWRDLMIHVTNTIILPNIPKVKKSSKARPIKPW